jgi:hypothetical protein
MGTYQIGEVAKGEAIKNSQIWVVIGDQELPSVITRGVIWHYSWVYDV